MDKFDFYIALAVTNLIVVGGWAFSILQNRSALRRSQRVRALAEAYDTLVRAGIDGGKPARRDAAGNVIDYSRDLERAIANVHLYGSQEQVELANKFVRTLSKDKVYAADELVGAIRDDVRQEMGMARYAGAPIFLKQTIKSGP